MSAGTTVHSAGSAAIAGVPFVGVPLTAESYEQLVERVGALTGLNGRQASVVASEFSPGSSPSRKQIIRAAQTLGYDTEEE